MYLQVTTAVVVTAVIHTVGGLRELWQTLLDNVLEKDATFA